MGPDGILISPSGEHYHHPATRNKTWNIFKTEIEESFRLTVETRQRT